jgi:TonB-dependent starch-binding outer membrane protein SusC
LWFCLVARLEFLHKEITVSGKVTDTDQKPVTGANIVVKGTTDGTITNATGDYSIQALPDAILEFSFIGMVRQEIPVSNRTTINVVMAYDAIGLEEVVAVGYGVVRKADLTSAISKVDGELLHNQPVASPASLLIGKSTGVHVITNSGAPGASATVRIRGLHHYHQVEMILFMLWMAFQQSNILGNQSERYRKY